MVKGIAIISGDQLKKNLAECKPRLEDWRKDNGEGLSLQEIRYCAAMNVYEEIMQLIEDMLAAEPTADVEPVKHGHWIRVIGDDYKCSECEAAVWATKGHPIEMSKFRWRCGAKMDKEK